MTTWPDEASSAEDEYEFYDPTAAQTSDGEEDERPERDWRDGDLPEGTIETDFRGVFHMWLTPEGRLAKIRISNRWRERCRTTPLTAMLTAGFKQRQKEASGNESIRLEPQRVDTTEGVDQAFLSRWLETIFDVQRKESELDADGPAQHRGRWVSGGDNRGSGANGKVTVRLGKGARTTAITIDEEWAKQTRVSQLCDAIQEAHDNAYATFQEPVFEPGEYGRLGIEMATLDEEMRVRAENMASTRGR